MSRSKLRWAMLQQVGGQVVSYGFFLALAAVLRPDQIGIVAMASVWVGMLTAFAESGLGSALIQRRDLRPEHLSTTFAINVGVGIALTLAGVMLALPAAGLFRSAAVAPVMAALSIGFVIRSLGLTQLSLAQRELDFRALAMRDLVANLIGGLTGLVLALRGAGVWSLVGMTLTTASVGTALLWWLSPWRPRRAEISRSAGAELWPYGSRILGFNLFKGFTQNADRLVVGVALGPHAVGIYTLAARLVLHPATVLAGGLGTYLFPRFSQLQDVPSRVQSIYRRGVGAILVLLAPVLVLAAVLAPPALPLLGPEWREAVPLVQVLAIAALLQAVFSPAGQLMKGRGRPGWLFAWAVGFSALTLAGLWFGSRNGVTGAGIGYAAAHVAALPVIVLVSRRLAGVGVTDLLAAAAPVGAAAAAMAACLLAARRVAEAWGPVALIGGCIVGAAVYLGVATRLNPDLAAEWRGPVATGAEDAAGA
jgi:PST family polysaccharide transporter